MCLIEEEDEIGDNIEEDEEQEQKERSGESFAFIHFREVAVSLSIHFPHDEEEGDTGYGDYGLVYEVVHCRHLNQIKLNQMVFFLEHDFT